MKYHPKEAANLQPYEIKLIKYALTCFVLEFSKLIILLIFFIVNDSVNDFFISLFVLIPLRWNSGGIHFHSYLGCLCGTFLFFIASTLLLPSLKITYITAKFLFYLCLFLHLLIAPIPSAKRPSITITLKRKYKIRSILFLIVLGIMIRFLQRRASSIILGTLTLHTFQLMTAYIIRQQRR